MHTWGGSVWNNSSIKFFTKNIYKINVQAKLNNGQIIVGNEGSHLGCFQGPHIPGFMRSLFGYKDFLRDNPKHMIVVDLDHHYLIHI